VSRNGRHLFPLSLVVADVPRDEVDRVSVVRKHVGAHIRRGGEPANRADLESRTWPAGSIAPYGSLAQATVALRSTDVANSPNDR